MNNELNPNVFAFSLASVLSIIYILCAVIFALFPEAALTLFQNMFHGIDLAKIAIDNISFGSVLIGLVEIIISSLIFGWLFALFYNYLADRK
ncbi:hypothetical protein J4409_02155 [Candidatus Woesearchaeota archaeon]|nr:hypothetical protein [Candidatus Woesearchaeota archaeon]